MWVDDGIDGAATGCGWLCVTWAALRLCDVANKLLTARHFHSSNCVPHAVNGGVMGVANASDRT